MLSARIVSGLAALALCGALPMMAHAQFGGLPGPSANFVTVATGAQAQMERPGLYRFLDERTLRSHWQRFGLGGAFPTVDWTQSQVVLIHLGRRSNGGYSLYVGGMERVPSGRIRITAVESTPAEGQATAQVLTSPYVAIAVDRSMTNFEVVWTKTVAGGLIPGGSVPNGSTVLIGPGSVTIINPLIGPYGVWGGDYYSYCSAPETLWITNDADLLQYNRQYLGDPRAVGPFDWRTERLMAVHLGSRETAVAIETVGFERKGDRAVLKLRETAPGRMRARSKAPVSPFLLVRVARDVQRVDVEWEKR